MLATPEDGVTRSMGLGPALDCHCTLAMGDGDFNVPPDYCTGCIRSRSAVTCSEAGAFGTGHQAETVTLAAAFFCPPLLFFTNLSLCSCSNILVVHKPDGLARAHMLSTLDCIVSATQQG
ncbi:MAG: hypothetical protein FRX49_01334 [Trebouxia sp. A1-2]|nr:MAG: hypothetical protein FRX49_01334 [Trebouxia sp. A1-2]